MTVVQALIQSGQIQAVLDEARLDLNDLKTSGSDATCRYPDSGLLTFCNDFVQAAIGIRPDLLTGLWSALPLNLLVTDPFPFPAKYIGAAAHYIVFRAFSRDDENVDYAVAKTHHDLFMEGMKL